MVLPLPRAEPIPRNSHTQDLEVRNAMIYSIMHKDNYKDYDIVSTHGIITQIGALCARARTKDHSPRMSLIRAQILVLISSIRYYYYHLRSTCMYICKDVCIYIQVSRKGEKRS